MAKSSFVLVLLLLINFANIFVIGKSAVDGSNNDKENAINAFSGSVNNLEKYYSHALVALTENIKSEFQNLKAQVARLEVRVERHDTFMNDSMEEIKRQLQTEGVEKKNGVQVQGQNLPRHCPTGFNYSVAGHSKCYAVLEARVNWETAQQRCKQLHNNAQLAVIINSREVQITTEILQNHECPTVRTEGYRADDFWIGGRRSNINDCNSPFLWRSNSGTTFTMQYTNWAPGEPNCAGQEGCASINKKTSSKWNDLGCSWNTCSLCEVTIRRPT